MMLDFKAAVSYTILGSFVYSNSQDAEEVKEATEDYNKSVSDYIVHNEEFIRYHNDISELCTKYCSKYSNKPLTGALLYSFIHDIMEISNEFIELYNAGYSYEIDCLLWLDELVCYAYDEKNKVNIVPLSSVIIKDNSVYKTIEKPDFSDIDTALEEMTRSLGTKGKDEDYKVGIKACICVISQILPLIVFPEGLK